MVESRSENPSALLLMLLDGRAPAGAHSHSGGMEAAVAAGVVTGLEGTAGFCRGRLRTAGRVASAFAATACAVWHRSGSAADWRQLDAELSARTPSPAQRAASRQLGGGLRRLLRAVRPDLDLTAWSHCPSPAPHHPLVLGAAVAVAGCGPELAARAAALGICTGSASAAVRLLGLDPYAVQAMLAGLAAEIDLLAAAWSTPSTDPAAFAALPADGAPALDLLADVQLTAEVRLFAS